eukprot:m.470653 g.470653  ORF g.470653 m.470653 type:complete len:109 (+) comp30048_c0_seq1:303-629(+)
MGLTLANTSTTLHGPVHYSTHIVVFLFHCVKDSLSRNVLMFFDSDFTACSKAQLNCVKKQNNGVIWTKLLFSYLVGKFKSIKIVKSCFESAFALIGDKTFLGMHRSVG